MSKLYAPGLGTPGVPRRRRLSDALGLGSARTSAEDLNLAWLRFRVLWPTLPIVGGLALLRHMKAG